jgi:hypothetical protein
VLNGRDEQAQNFHEESRSSHQHPHITLSAVCCLVNCVFSSSLADPPFAARSAELNENGNENENENENRNETRNPHFEGK